MNAQRPPHTPGPWKAGLVFRTDLDDDPLGQYEVEPAATKLTIRYTDAEPETPELDAVHAENAANARLIELVPEFLKAVQSVANCDANEEDHKSAEWQADVQRAIDRCRSLIRRINRGNRAYAVAHAGTDREPLPSALRPIRPSERSTT